MPSPTPPPPRYLFLSPQSPFFLPSLPTTQRGLYGVERDIPINRRTQNYIPRLGQRGQKPYPVQRHISL